MRRRLPPRPAAARLDELLRPVTDAGWAAWLRRLLAEGESADSGEQAHPERGRRKPDKVSE
jgi:hypothetical protein